MNISDFVAFQFCPSCARDTLQRVIATTTTTTFKEFECRGCGAWLAQVVVPHTHPPLDGGGAG